MHYSQDTKSSLIADNIYQYQPLDLKYSSPFSSRLTGLDWASASSNEVSEWGASLTRICSAAFRSCLLTGTTCTVVSKQALDSDEPQSSNNFWNIARHLIGHSDARERLLITFSGWLKEFSSITLPDVRTVTVDPTALTLASSQVVEIPTLTACGPKFTICTEVFKINTTNSPFRYIRMQDTWLAFTLR